MKLLLCLMLIAILGKVSASPARSSRYYSYRMANEEEVDEPEDDDVEQRDDEEDEEDPPSFSKLFPVPNNRPIYSNTFFNLRQSIEQEGWNKPPKPVRQRLQHQGRSEYVDDLSNPNLRLAYRMDDEDEEEDEEDEEEDDDPLAPDFQEMFPSLPSGSGQAPPVQQSHGRPGGSPPQQSYQSGPPPQQRYESGPPPPRRYESGPPPQRRYESGPPPQQRYESGPPRDGPHGRYEGRQLPIGPVRSNPIRSTYATPVRVPLSYVQRQAALYGYNSGRQQYYVQPLRRQQYVKLGPNPNYVQQSMRRPQYVPYSPNYIQQRPYVPLRNYGQQPYVVSSQNNLGRRPAYYTRYVRSRSNNGRYLQ